MLIRSQDGKTIVNLNNVTRLDALCAIANGNTKSKHRISADGDTLGLYSNKEKALKVLDLIQRVYISQNKISQTYMENIGVLESEYVGCEVFHIPTDEEVDEPTVKDIIDDLMKM